MIFQVTCTLQPHYKLTFFLQCMSVIIYGFVWSGGNFLAPRWQHGWSIILHLFNPLVTRRYLEKWEFSYRKQNFHGYHIIFYFQVAHYFVFLNLGSTILKKIVPFSLNTGWAWQTSSAAESSFPSTLIFFSSFHFHHGTFEWLTIIATGTPTNNDESVFPALMDHHCKLVLTIFTILNENI